MRLDRRKSMQFLIDETSQYEGCIFLVMTRPDLQSFLISVTGVKDGGALELAESVPGNIFGNNRLSVGVVFS